MQIKSIFRADPSWSPSGSNRSFLEYLRCMRRKPGFSFRIIAAALFAVGGYRAYGAVRGTEIYVGGLAAVLLVGYLAWRIIFRR